MFPSSQFQTPPRLLLPSYLILSYMGDLSRMRFRKSSMHDEVTEKRQKCCMYDSPPSRINFNNIQTRRQSVSYWLNYVVCGLKTFTSDCHWQVLCAECPTVNQTRALLEQRIHSVWVDNLTGIDTFMVLQGC